MRSTLGIRMDQPFPTRRTAEQREQRRGPVRDGHRQHARNGESSQPRAARDIRKGLRIQESGRHSLGHNPRLRGADRAVRHARPRAAAQTDERDRLDQRIDGAGFDNNSFAGIRRHKDASRTPIAALHDRLGRSAHGDGEINHAGAACGDRVNERMRIAGLRGARLRPARLGEPQIRTTTTSLSGGRNYPRGHACRTKMRRCLSRPRPPRSRDGRR